MNNVQTGLEYDFTGNLHKCNHDKKSRKTRKAARQEKMFCRIEFLLSSYFVPS